MDSIADLFEPQPEKWGLRGDIRLWMAMQSRFEEIDIPATAAELHADLIAAFRELVGVSIDSREKVYREEFDFGGMSGGQVDVKGWQEKLLPLVVERAFPR
jgi:hypothetical protein